MKAVRIHRFGSPEVISLDDMPKPAAGRGEVVVRVNAAGIGPWDALIRKGESVLEQPLPLTLGSDLSGVVDSVGVGVEKLKVGDEVFGVTNERFTGATPSPRLPKQQCSRPSRRVSTIRMRRPFRLWR